MGAREQLQLEMMRELGQIESRTGHAADLLIRMNAEQRTPCGCGGSGGHGHGHETGGGSEGGGTGSTAIIRNRDDFRRMLVSMARGLLAGGLTEFECKAIGKDSMSAACCGAWNDLLEDLAQGGDGWIASDTVAVYCGGWA